ncbi:hypothetical protein B5S33_g2324 [[Candida] boidinii]|nr:hypothetical protein B5S30_g3675 [[Candida] boidinii]OWB83693.1 hypothetical protein B5S33_g2324 [[Candida] boidinii]
MTVTSRWNESSVKATGYGIMIVRINDLYAKLAHVNVSDIEYFIKKGTIIANDKVYKELKNIRYSSFVNCMLGQSKRANATPYLKDKYIREERPFSLIYSDVSQVLNNEPSKVFNAPNYFVTFRCALTGYTQIYGMKRKLEACNWVKTQFQLKKYLF